MRFSILFISIIVSCFSISASGGHSDLDVVVLGDSNTWIGGDDCSKDVGWTKWFTEKFQPASIRSYARSGATWTNNKSTRLSPTSYSEILDDNNVIYNQAVRLIEGVLSDRQPVPEVIIIGAGTNDAWFESKRPFIYHESVDEVFGNDKKMIYDRKPEEAVSLASSIRLTCELLMKQFPKAQIVLLTPPQITQCGYDAQRRVADMITECGRRLSLNVISLDSGCGTYRIQETESKHNTSDGAHNSIAGAKRTGNYVASQLNSILIF